MKEETANTRNEIVKDENAKEQPFVWRNDEVELLLRVAHEFKVKKTAENVDWESVPSRYDLIWDKFKLQMTSETDKDFPHRPKVINKQALTRKLKVVQLKYRQAVDSGRSSHERVVLVYFEWCEKILGSSPATEQIPSRVETVDLDEPSEPNEEMR